MNRLNLKRVIYFVAPILLLLPLGLSWNFGQYFQSVILQPQKTGITTLHFHDHNRSRPLVTELWYPVDAETPSRKVPGFWVRCDEARDAPLSQNQKKYPLILMSHGNGGDRFNNAWLAEILAANGYIVAAMDHYGNTWNNKIPECYARPWERPQDVSFVLDELLKHPRFAGHIDESRIGFAGYSLGGATGIWVAGATASAFTKDKIAAVCAHEIPDIVTPEVLSRVNFNDALGNFGDPRIKAFVLMAPALGWLFDEKSLSAVKKPIFIFAPEKDQIVPVDGNAKIFAMKLSRVTLKIMPGEANHYIFLNRASLLGKGILEPKIFEDHVTVNRKQIHEEIGKQSIQFFQDNLK